MLAFIVPCSIAAFVAFLFIWDTHQKNKVHENYSTVVWDDEGCIYVVRDRETHQQYMVEFNLFTIKFKETNLDWSHTPL